MDTNLYNNIEYGFGSIMIFVIIIIIFGLCVLSLTPMNKTVIEYVDTNLYNSIPLPDDYKKSLSENVDQSIKITKTPEIVTTQILKTIPENIIEKVYKDQQNVKYNKTPEEILYESEFVIKKIDMGKDDNNNQLQWDEQIDRCKAMQGTIDDIDWNSYVFGYRPTLILY